ncbi:hypothetical protein M5D96_008016 [Drosophila gunungcola]|uniref:Gustatory receptor n=1 Tax=Drosophila gunungcola TaxID=103775 RepID=A0A9P9YME3_9MUSC|nr:hypothetical protein M5D96_008016 [Drosophila gunungcola]
MKGPTLNFRRHPSKDNGIKSVEILAKPETPPPKFIEESNMEFNILASEKLPNYAKLDLFHRAVYPLGLLINLACTFVWNYMDLFIMMISKGLSYRFEQITARIRKLEHEEVCESVFIQIREHYVKLCELLEFVDSAMSSLILLSKLRWPINYVYFWYSLLYLIGRTAFVFLTAADINEESRRGLGVLRRVSSRSWCVEVERLIFQMTTQTVALSGKKFYFLTLLFISQIYGLLPVSNVRALDVSDIRFRWFSSRIFYSCLILILNICEFGTVINYVIKVAINFHTSSTLSLYIHLFFWRLAIQWPRIMRIWSSVEQLFLRVPYRFYGEYKMKKRIYVVFAIVMSSALVEHCLLLLNSFHLSNLERTQCKINVTYLESIYKWERPHLYMILPYQIWLLPILEWVNQTIAYPRSFTDCFIMCIGIGLAARFHQLYRRIAAVHRKVMPAVFWTEVREHYLALKRLVHLLDAAIAPLVLLAFGNNIFKNIGVDFLVMVAFWYSLGFAVVRTLLTIFVASSINDYERKIVTALRDVPSRAWSIERFILVIAQFFGVLPVSGIWPSSRPEKVRFRWISASFLAALILFCFSIVDCALSSKVVLDNGLKIYTIGSLSFSVICIFCFGVFLLLSRRWPYIIRRTAECEQIFLEPAYDCRHGRGYSSRLRLWGVCLLHSTYVGSALYNNHLAIVECKLKVDFWQNYFQRERQQLFLVMHFSAWWIPFIEWTTLSMTFVWNFVDIFLILICRGIYMAATLMVYELVLINQMAGSEVQKNFCEGGVGSSKSIFS